MRVFFETLWIFWIILFKWIILILDYIVVGCIGLYCCGLFWVILLWIITESISNGMKDNITHDGCCVFRGGTRKSHVALVTLKCEAASCLGLYADTDTDSDLLCLHTLVSVWILQAYSLGCFFNKSSWHEYQINLVITSITLQVNNIAPTFSCASNASKSFASLWTVQNIFQSTLKIVCDYFLGTCNVDKRNFWERNVAKIYGNKMTWRSCQ